MAEAGVSILWPDGRRSLAMAGQSWLVAARQADQTIPTACGMGSCGACEIEVNGTMVRACLATVPPVGERLLQVELAADPSW